MAKKSNKKKKCNCWSCKLALKIQKFDESLTLEQHKMFREIFDEVWNEMEAASMDLEVLNAKVEGTWPKSDSKEKYYHSVDDRLYEVVGKLIE